MNGRPPSSLVDEPHGNLPPTTILRIIEPHFNLFSNQLDQVAHHDRAYVHLLRTSKEDEKTALAHQDIAVTQALQAGKNKREIRKLKNRLSAIRSRARKESETKLSKSRLHSLEAQVALYSHFVTKLINSSSRTRDALLKPPADKRLPRALKTTSRHDLPQASTLSPVSSSSLPTSPPPSSFSLTSVPPTLSSSPSNTIFNSNVYNYNCYDHSSNAPPSNQTSFTDPDHSLGASMVSFDPWCCSSDSGSSDYEEFETEQDTEHESSSGTEDGEFHEEEEEELENFEEIDQLLYMELNHSDGGGFTFGMDGGVFDGGPVDEVDVENDVHMWLDETFEF